MPTAIRRSRARAILAGLGAFMLALAGVGCDSGDTTGGPAAGPAAGPTPVLRSDAEIRLPLDRYLLDARQQYLLSKAINTLGRACMTGFGLSWPATPTWVGGAPARNDRRYSVTDPASVRTQGYHAVELLKRHGTIARQERSLPRPSEDATAVWSGTGASTYRGRPVPDGGCNGAAVRQLSGGSTVADADLAQRLQLSTFDRTRTDARVQRVFASWRDCMGRHGYKYQDPFAAADDKRWRSERVSAAEIATASADVDCKRQTNLAGTMYAVETAYQRQAIAENSARLAELGTYLKTQLDRAATLPPRAGAGTREQ